MSTIHDKGYKYLFSNPLIVKELLQSFVSMDWVHHIDFTKAETIDKSYVSDQYKEYEADIIYKLYFKDTELYLYLLIEFQSTVDRFIAFRMLQYIMELYRELIYKHKCKRLPVVFPILIYNGDKKWTAPLSLQELIEIPPVLKQCEPYIPQFQYYPIIENAIDKTTLHSMMNVISTVFLLETGDAEEFFKTVDRIRELLHIYDNEPLLLRTLLYWLLQYLQLHGIVEETARIISILDKPQEAGTMLSRTLEKIKKDLRQEGFNHGVQVGIQKGIQKGMKDGLLRGVTQERINIARNLLKHGMDEKSILKITKLKKYQLDEIKKDK
jgi:predicted transposase/invertase (TIGR01784 family)